MGIAISNDEIAALAKRLQVARCWHDESSYGTRVTKWMHLIPADLDRAAFILRQVAALSPIQEPK